MMLSTRGRYALRLMIDIARQGEAGALVTMRQAAEREDLSVKYLEQLGCAPVSCLEDGAEACPRRDQCVAINFWRGLDQAIEDYVDNVTLADLVQMG